MGNDSKIPDGPIVNVIPAAELPSWRTPTDEHDAPAFCMLELGSGDGVHGSTTAVVLSSAGAAALHQKLASLLGEPAAKREGYMLALRRVRRFGQDKKGDAALTDEERYILDGAAEILEGEAPGEAE